MAEEENRLAAAAPLQMDVDQIENLQDELQVNEGGGPPPEQPAQQNNDGQNPPNVQVNNQGNSNWNNNWNNNAVQNVFPPGRHPKYHDVPAPRGNAYQLQRGQKLVHQCLKYARKRPWRQYVCEFFSWVETFEIYECGDEFIKDTMVWSMKGQAMDMIHPHRAGSATYANNPTWRGYARAVEHILHQKLNRSWLSKNLRPIHKAKLRILAVIWQLKEHCLMWHMASLDLLTPCWMKLSME